MTRRFVGASACVLLLWLALPSSGYAQEAVLTGTVTDSTGGVLPGVTVTAVHEATGNTFVAITDETGSYRMPVRVGGYVVTAELQGFATVTRPGVQLLVGQTAGINLQMAPSSVQETITVTADAPLLNVATSNLGGNVDPTQVQELPVDGRNWMALALLAPGSRTSSTNANSPLPDRNGGEVREYQTNLDGMQVTNSLGGGSQPTFSQEMIAEFQFISNRFDATQGRSQAVQVNVITKSGTNRLAGTFRANFRDDGFNAEDPVLGLVVPISNQQYAGSAGGPIIRDRLHYFGFYEYEREPRTSIWNTPFPAFNVALNGLLSKRLGGARLDYQVSTATRLMVKGNLTKTYTPFGAGNNNHPAATASTGETQDTLMVQLTNVLSSRALNELRVGYAGYIFRNRNLTRWSNHWAATNGPYGPVTVGSPRIRFTGFTILPNPGYPRHRVQNLYSINRRVHAVVQRGRAARPEDRRRVPAAPRDERQLHQLQRRDRRARRSAAAEPRADPARPVQCRHVELRGALAARPHLPPRHPQGASRRRRPAVLRGLRAGRLADHREADAEPGRAVRPDVELVRAVRRVRAVHGEGPAAGRRQHPAARRLRLPVGRPHGDPRRRREVLRRGDHARRPLRARAGDDRGARGRQ
jgi:hypothetical protein